MTNSLRRRAGLRCAGLVLALVALLLSCREATPPADRGLKLVASTLPGGGHPFAIVADDFNRDGKTDLAVTNPKVSKVSIYLGHGDGTFEKPANFATGKQPRGLVAGDFNEDGWLDLAVASTGRNSVSLHLGRGDGSFRVAELFLVGSRPFMLQPADFNHDGHLDLVVSNEGERDNRRGLSVLLGNGRGGFSVSSYPTGRYAADVAPADFNGDGQMDVAVATWGTNDVNVHFGRGDGSFVARNSFTYAGHGIYRVLAADLNRDGNSDMVWSDLRRDGLYLLYGDGEGGFPVTRLLPAGRGVRHAVAFDLNGDGWLDLIGVNTGAGNISINLSDGKGDFLPPQTYASGVFPRTVAVADLNGDGRPDLAVANMRSNDVHVFLNQGPAPLQVVARQREAEEQARELTALELPTFRFPNGLALDPSEQSLLVADQQNHRIARVEIATGEVTTLGRLDEANQVLERSRQQAAQAGDEFLLCGANCFLAQNEYFRGNAARAADYGRQAVDCAEKLGRRTSIVLAYMQYGMGLLVAGPFDEAERVLRRGLASADEGGVRLLRPGIQGGLADARDGGLDKLLVEQARGEAPRSPRLRMVAALPPRGYGALDS
ncbi:MAG: VCBS repeat-containing protein, partial [Myxococcales bacterium]|nr:VCBS repeat-containing protein [Myxococcales bacterium]